jgi:hypothetical protein
MGFRCARSKTRPGVVRWAEAHSAVPTLATRLSKLLVSDSNVKQRHVRFVTTGSSPAIALRKRDARWPSEQRLMNFCSSSIWWSQRIRAQLNAAMRRRKQFAVRAVEAMPVLHHASHKVPNFWRTHNAQKISRDRRFARCNIDRIERLCAAEHERTVGNRTGRFCAWRRQWIGTARARDQNWAWHQRQNDEASRDQQEIAEQDVAARFTR